MVTFVHLNTAVWVTSLGVKRKDKYEEWRRGNLDMVREDIQVAGVGEDDLLLLPVKRVKFNGKEYSRVTPTWINFTFDGYLMTVMIKTEEFAGHIYHVTFINAILCGLITLRPATRAKNKSRPSGLQKMLGTFFFPPRGTFELHCTYYTVKTNHDQCHSPLLPPFGGHLTLQSVSFSTGHTFVMSPE